VGEGEQRTIYTVGVALEFGGFLGIGTDRYPVP